MIKSVRNRLPNRRPAENLTIEHEGSFYHLTIGFFQNGLPAEIFLNHERGNSLLDTTVHDAAILASLALQFGASLQEIAHSLKRDKNGVPASPLGAAIDRALA